jgi:hypothetical protein
MPTTIAGIPCEPTTGAIDWKETAKVLHKIATFYFDCVFDSTLSDTESFNNYAKAR